MGLCFAMFVFLTFRGPLASHDSNPYPNRSRIARYNATPVWDPSLTPKMPSKKFMWVPVLSQEMKHINFFLGSKMGCFGWGPKTFMCFFPSPEMARPGISTPRPKILDSQNLPPANALKIPKKYPKNTKNAYFGCFFSVFLGYFLGFQNFGTGSLCWKSLRASSVP